MDCSKKGQNKGAKNELSQGQQGAAESEKFEAGIRQVTYICDKTEQGETMFYFRS